MSARVQGAARVLGAAIFGVGVALLVLVFILAVTIFHRVPQSLTGPLAAAHGVVLPLATAGVQGLLLVVMAYISSLLAGRGLDLLATASSREGS